MPIDLRETTVLYFFRRAGDTRTCETRPEPDGRGYELVVTEGRRSYVEHFSNSQALTDRQCELRYAWLAHGWRDADSGDGIEDE